MCFNQQSASSLIMSNKESDTLCLLLSHKSNFEFSIIWMSLGSYKKDLHKPMSYTVSYKHKSSKFCLTCTARTTTFSGSNIDKSGLDTRPRGMRTNKTCRILSEYLQHKKGTNRVGNICLWKQLSVACALLTKVYSFEIQPSKPFQFTSWSTAQSYGPTGWPTQSLKS